MAARGLEFFRKLKKTRSESWSFRVCPSSKRDGGSPSPAFSGVKSRCRLPLIGLLAFNPANDLVLVEDKPPARLEAEMRQTARNKRLPHSPWRTTDQPGGIADPQRWAKLLPTL